MAKFSLGPYMLKAVAPSCLLLIAASFLVETFVPYGHFVDLSPLSKDGPNWYMSAGGNVKLLGPVILHWWLAESCFVLSCLGWLTKAAVSELDSILLDQVFLSRCAFFALVLPVMIVYIYFSTHGQPALVSHGDAFPQAIVDLLPLLNPLPISLCLIAGRRIYSSRNIVHASDSSEPNNALLTRQRVELFLRVASVISAILIVSLSGLVLTWILSSA